MFTKEISKTIKPTGQVPTKIMTALSMKDNGWTTNLTGRENKYLKMVLDMTAISYKV